jgi:penicillin amidase
MDLWRRASQGHLAEVLGSNFIGRDAMTRRMQYRGDLNVEWASYGPDTKAIAGAFVRGVNAWIAIARARPPEEFVLAGWLPEFWEPEDLLSRADAFVSSGNAPSEVVRARLTAAVGPARADRLLGGSATRSGEIDSAVVTFAIGDALRQVGAPAFFATLAGPMAGSGSNAWAISRNRSASGEPLVAVDPHRPLAHPSSRYLVHLSAPGWKVIGATAPWMPGVAIGHTNGVAWGMTAFDVDTEDLYVERLNPANPHQIEVDGNWRNTTVVTESLWVKGRREPVLVQREYTPHGVVVAVDSEQHLAFTVRWSGSEPGTASELAALGLDRADSASAFRDALQRWRMPAVEVVYAERGGAIGSDVAAFAPVRRDWEGLAPVPGWNGRYEWTGWRTADALRRGSDGAAGYVVSANDSRPRLERLHDVLAQPRALSVDDSKALQQDVRAANAGHLIPLIAQLHAARDDVEGARRTLLGWDRRVAADSAASTLYVSWERAAKRMLVEGRMPMALVDEFLARDGDALVPALVSPSSVWFDGDAVKARDTLLLGALTSAVDELNARGGVDAPDNLWGRLHVTLFAHPLGITDVTRRRFNIGPFPNSGYADTVMSTGGRGLEASVGASFRAVFDAGDWDRSVAQNAPGQSGNPGSAHFRDLAALWAAGQYFPLAFSDDAVQREAESTLTLVPQRSTQNPQQQRSQ